MRWLSLQSPSSWRDVPAAEAWPPSSEPGQTAPRMIVPVVSPRGLSLVPSRSFASGLLLVPLRSPSRPAVRARSRSGVSTCSRGRGSLVGIVVACTQSRMSGNRAVRVGRLRAGAPNCRPAAPITLGPRPPGCLAARRGSCAAYPLRWNSNVKLSLSAARLPGGAGRAQQRRPCSSRADSRRTGPRAIARAFGCRMRCRRRGLRPCDRPFRAARAR